MIFKRKKQSGIFDDLPVAPENVPIKRTVSRKAGRRAMLIPDAPYTANPRADLMQTNTGKQKEDWLKILFESEVSEAKASQIAAYLINNYRVQKWWANSIALMYLKWRTETKGSAAESKVLRITKEVASPVGLVYNKLNSASRYGDKFERFLKLVNNEKLILKFNDETRASIYLQVKADVSVVIIEHEFIQDASAKKIWTKFWNEQLSSLIEGHQSD
jgi:hypothetical protein